MNNPFVFESVPLRVEEFELGLEFESAPTVGANERPYVIRQIVAGVRDPYQLTDRVFFLPPRQDRDGDADLTGQARHGAA